MTITQRNNPAKVWFWQFYSKKSTIDTTPPREFAQHARPLLSYMPGDDISIEFDEAIDCSSTSVTGRASGGAVFSSASFVIICKANEVFIDFAASLTVTVGA